MWVYLWELERDQEIGKLKKKIAFACEYEYKSYNEEKMVEIRYFKVLLSFLKCEENKVFAADKG